VALQFFSDIVTGFTYAGLYVESGQGATNTITLFGGTQPTAAQVVASWPTYSAQYLVHWTSVGVVAPNGDLFSFATPAAKAAFRSGTGAWAIWWPGAVTDAAVQGSTLPRTDFCILPASESGGNGCFRMTSLAITSGTSYQPSDIAIKMGFV
jgi:hypothetical protein